MLLRPAGRLIARRALSGLPAFTQGLIDTLTTAKLGNGLTMRYADTAPGDDSRPPVVFMHGWPECWFSWRHQLEAVHAAGYRGIAPDLRGFGGTDAPAETAAYGVAERTGDMAALLAHLELETADFVGHDHGALTGWLLAQLRPEIVRSYYGMSVPTSAARPRFGMLALLRRLKYGDEAKPEGSVYGWGHLFPWKPRAPLFHYVLHHQLPGAAADYAEDTRAAMLAVQFGDVTEDAAPPLYDLDDSPLYHDGRAVPVWKRKPQPTKLNDWVTEAEADYVIREFEKPGGWEGGLNWYRVLDLDWAATPELTGDRRKLAMPVGFLAGTEDPVIVKMAGGVENATKELRAVCVGDPALTFLDGGGHWIQQERPGDVNAALLDFLETHRGA